MVSASQRRRLQENDILVLIVPIFLVLLLIDPIRGFQQPTRFHASVVSVGKAKTCRMIAMDPVETSRSVASGLELLNSQISSYIHHVPSSEGVKTLEGILSTMYTTTADGLMVPAHGHSNPLFGPPDPHLDGRSIAPTAKALLDLGVQSSSSVGQGELPPAAQQALNNGWKIVDLGDSTVGNNNNVLPGFSKTGGILPDHAYVPSENPEGFVKQVEWSANFLNVIDKLPTVAFMYTLVEFFILRPGLDLFKEDIEEEGAEVLMETVSSVGVRLAAFWVISLISLGIFG